MKRLLWISEWAPNGTNDLIITDERGEITNVVQEATFGFDVKPEKNSKVQPFQIYDQVTMEEPGFAYDLGGSMVRQVKIKDVLKYIACSPVDPQGKSVLKQLKQLKLIKAA